MSDPALVWFRQDLRLDDNLALLAAAQHTAVIPVFVWSPQEEGDWAPASASRWWLHQSLASLSGALKKLGSRLIIRRGDVAQELRAVCEETGATAVYWNRRYEPCVVSRDTRIKSSLQRLGVTAESFNASLLFEPWEVRTKQDRPFQVYTPYWNACRASTPPALPQPPPAKLPAPGVWPASVKLEALGLEPTIDWAGEMRRHWQPGEQGASRRLDDFLAGPIADYADGRNRPDLEGSSSLSPHLHFGEISPRAIWHAVCAHAGDDGSSKTVSGGMEVYLKELVWREFAYHLLFHFPTTTDEPLRREFAAFPWREDRAALRAWQRGRTGFPYIDAGMRQLWAIGWMHNRVRMAVASFLVKDLLVPWQEGARWFWDTLVDADLANNTLGWQWTAGCGADAAPYFRVFNPVTQGERFDPNGDYVRRWVPELADLPTPVIHQPWKASADVLRRGGVELGVTYPRPIVDHAEARERALAGLASISKPAT